MSPILLGVLLTSVNLDDAISKPSQLLDDLQSMKPKTSDGILEHEELCLTKICNDTASEILKNMDSSVDPCDNFYEFACGGYSKSAVIPDGIPVVDVPYQIEVEMMEQMKMSFEKPIKKNEPRPLKLTKKFYKSCINDESLAEENGVDSLLDVVKSLGGWPVLEGEKWNADEFNWTASLSNLQKMGFSVWGMPQVKLDLNLNNLSELAIYLIMEPGINFFAPQNSTIRDLIREDLIDISVDLGANRTFAEQEFAELLNFSLRLHEMNLKNSDPLGMRNLTKLNLMKFNFTNLDFSPKISWREYVKDIISPSIEISDNTTFFVITTKTIRGVEDLMAETPKRVQANYMLWNFIFRSLRLLNGDIRKKYNNLLQDTGLESLIEVHPRKKSQCIKTTIENMPIGASALYVRNHFDKKLKGDASEMLANIRNQINQSLEASTRLSSVMKEKFHRKLEKMSFSIAYPDEFFNISKLEELYKDLHISTSNNYLQNTLNVLGFKTRDYLAKFRESLKEPDWKSSHSYGLYSYSLTWNAYSLGPINSVRLPALFFQSSLNKHGNPQYTKYGSIGSFISHEIHHAFDKTERSFDENHQRINWDFISRIIFSRQDQCFIDQYGNYSIGGTNLDGNSLLDENLADYGMKMAYSAYLDWSSKENQSEPQLHGLPYNPRQMFWISLANNFCERKRDPNWYDLDDEHAPAEFRVIGALSNIPNFAEDFKCPLNSRMNPEEKCFV